jgi:hypothetical protein
MEILEKTAQDQKKQMNDVKHTEQESNIDMMTKSANEELAAARARMIFGFISAGVSIGAGVVSIGGAFGQLGKFNEGMTKFKEGTEESMKLGKVIMKESEQIGNVFSSMTRVSEGVTKGLDTTGGIIGSNHEHNSKMLDIQGKKEDQKVEETKNNIDTIRDMHNKVKELLQAIQEAEDRSSQSINRM